MADYTQPDAIEKRLRYFDGQFLKDQDFIDEQKYFIDRQRRYSRLLNVSGIIEGLTVKAGTNEVTVDPGTALDSKGRQIVLGQPDKVPLQGISGAVDLVISYNEIESDKAQAGSEGFTRFHEDPKLTVVTSAAKAPEAAITLARLTIEASGAVAVNNAARNYAGWRLPYDGAAPGQGLSLRAGDAGRIDLTGSLSVSGNVNIGTSSALSFGSAVRQMINLWSTGYGIGVQSSTQYFRTGKNFAWYKGGEHSDTELNTGTGGTVQMVINDGNVGIGISPPNKRLHVEAGELRVRASQNNTTADIGAFYAQNLTQGIGIGYNRIEAIGSNANQHILILPKGTGNVGIGATDPEYKLTVSAASAHLQLRRESTETTGGKQVFLELLQLDPAPAKVPEVYPSIRFHHNNRFWHRLEARGNGFHFKEGNLPGDSYVPVYTGSLQVGGSFGVASGQAVSGIPVIDFRSQQQRFTNHSGSRKDLTYTFTFGRPVVKAEAMLKTWFLRYNNNREYVQQAGVGCYDTRVSGNTVTVTVSFYLKDSSGNFDDPYEGEAIVVVVAQLSQAV